ncbi:glycosyltransferase [Aneurinibacillus sp. UBA3580]|jgi:glycosyltransferase involved in cell wall biosynthesis|uniref:glycosyltransferase n=1 Tax=Aneurinibacillus sp. UBA3580 TaxID=1946041 RepID=UPI00257B11F9|nr:glycosyltransferase [Aneurinibacillus sp. UBA3580]
MADKFSISHVSTVDVLGGAAIVAWRLMQAQRALGHDSVILAGYKMSPYLYTVPFPVDIDTNLHEKCKEQGFLYYEFQGSHKLVQHLLVKSADVIHLHNLHGNYFNPYSLSALSHIKPTIWTLHDMQPLTGHCAYSFDCERWVTGCGQCPDLQTYPPINVDTTSQLWWDKKTIYAHSYFNIVVPSKWLKEKVEKSIMREHKVELIYNGVDTATFSPRSKIENRRKYGIPENKFIIGSVANGGSFSDPRKGGYYTKIILDLLKKNGSDFLFVNIGSSEDSSNDPYVINTGYIYDSNQLAEIYSTLDVFLFTSIADNCPLVVLEALSCGIPIVSFSTGGVPELVQHGKCGFIAEYKNVGEIFHYIEYLRANPQLRMQFAKNARWDAITYFEHNIIVNQYEKLYTRVIEEFERNTYEARLFSLSELPNVIITQDFLEAEKVKKTNKFQEEIKATPKVMVIYDNKGVAIEKSTTYKSIIQQSYSNKSIQVGSFAKVDVNKIEADLIYSIDEGSVINPYFLEIMLQGYQEEDAICCKFTPLRVDDSIFYRNITPAQSNYSKTVDMAYKECIILSKELFLKNKDKIFDFEYINVSKLKLLDANFCMDKIDIFIQRKLKKFRNKKVYIYGAGSHTKDLLQQVNFDGIILSGIIDKNKQLDGQKYNEYPIYSLDKIDSLDFDGLLISSATYEQEIYEELKLYIPKEKIIRIYNN